MKKNESTETQEYAAQVGTRGSASIHSGKRSALHAWFRNRAGVSTAQLLALGLGTADFGRIFNDTTDALFDEAQAKALGLPTPKGDDKAPDSGKGSGESESESKGGESESESESESKGGEGEGEGEGEGDTKEGEDAEALPQPAPAKSSEDPMSSMVRAIAREEDAAVLANIRKAWSARNVKARREFARLRKMVEEKSGTPSGPVRIEIVRETEDGKKPEDMGVTHYLFPLLLAAVRASLSPKGGGLTPYLVGPAGGGKTHAAAAVHRAIFGNDGFEMQGACMTKTDIVGYKDGHGVEHDTPFSRSFRLGGVFLADEVDSWNPAALLAMNAALANGHASLPSGMVKRAGMWAPIFAGNTFGSGADRLYCGRAQLDAATLNRLAVISWDLDNALEAHLAGVVEDAKRLDLGLGGTPTADAWLKRVRAVRAAVEGLKVRALVTPRATVGGLRLFEQGVGQKHVEEMVLWAGMDKETRRRVEGAC